MSVMPYRRICQIARERNGIEPFVDKRNRKGFTLPRM